MAIYDCFQYFNEEHIANLRFNILNKHVDYFVIVESTVNHQGQKKDLHFKIEKYKKFKNKIKYIVVDDTPDIIKKPHEGGESLVEQHQRNSLMKVLNTAKDDDLIILSDVDEIPDLKKLNQYNKKNKYVVFSQKAFAYKLNLLNKAENNWHGSKMCLKKHLKSPQWLRNLKFKKYPFWRLDTFFSKKKYSNLLFVKNGGWHFTCLRTPEELEKKLLNFAHHYEFEESGLKINDIKKLINEKRVMYDHNVDQKSYKWSGKAKLKKIEMSLLPDYISSNLAKYKDWLD